MSTRRELLRHLFKLLDEREIPYCVLRNYRRLSLETVSDVDLLTLPSQADAVIACCVLAGERCGQSLVQRTRFVNHSLVIWNGGEGFTRIDVDTEKRWRRFHLLTAVQVLAARMPFTDESGVAFSIPDLRHEAVIVLTQALWQGKLSERYAGRLVEIRNELGDDDQLRDIFNQAFGLRKNLLAMINEPNFVSHLSGAVLRACFLRPQKLLFAARYFLKDIARLRSRKHALPGLQVRLIGASTTDAGRIAEKLAILFPIKKNRIENGFATDVARDKTLFKGGMLVETFDASDKPGKLLRQGWAQPDRGFAMVQHRGKLHCIHIGTGWMRDVDTMDEFSTFICETLARLQSSHPPNSSNGTFVVLLGLDGSGKTTLARNLTILASEINSPPRVRYQHWLPAVGTTREFPLPEPSNQPRKRKLAAGFVQSGLSVLRLTKNLVRAHLAWWMRLRPLRNSGYLVLVDRYFYNYYLDPVSVKYYGPRWVLDVLTRLFPKPEIVITLSAPPEILLRRKQELSEAEMREQAEVLKQLQFTTPHVIAADASEPAAQVAEKVMHRLREILS